MTDEQLPPSEIILYQTEDGLTRLQVRLQDQTVWLTQKLMAELFQTSVPNVSMHIRNVFAEGELQEGSVVQEFLTTAADGKSYATGTTTWTSSSRWATASSRCPARSSASGPRNGYANTS